MIDLTKLKVSLTKHGAHKVEPLLREFPKDQVLNNTWGTFEAIKINRVQASKNLSADSSEILPVIWDDVKTLEAGATAKLVFLAIVFSHHSLIEAMIAGSSGKLIGTINRDHVIGGKAYTNFACVLDELGLATYHDPRQVSYDLSSMLVTPGLPPLVQGLLFLKLREADWDGETNLIDECISLNFHRVLGLNPEEFTSWLAETEEQSDATVEKDELPIGDFKFSSGHNPKQEGDVPVVGKKAARTANLLHNKIQTALFDYLVNQYGEQAVSAEQAPGYQGASIDVVLEDAGEYIFYEIKTATSVRLCIREALSQLQEYAYWPGEIERAKRLVIVAMNPTTQDADDYLQYLREKFGLPIYYQQFDLERGELQDPN